MENIASATTAFWDINFWGLLGTFSGFAGIIISFMSWYYSRPSIKIISAKLWIREYDLRLINELKNKKDDEYATNRIDFNLDIQLANKRGGPGSVEKPVLGFEINKKYFFSRTDNIQISPITKSYNTVKIEPHISETTTTNLGKAFYLQGGEILDDELEYVIRGSNGMLQQIVKNFDNGNFFINYSDNFGRQHKQRIALETMNS